MAPHRLAAVRDGIREDEVERRRNDKLHFGTARSLKGEPHKSGVWLVDALRMRCWRRREHRRLGKRRKRRKWLLCVIEVCKQRVVRRHGEKLRLLRRRRRVSAARRRGCARASLCEPGLRFAMKEGGIGSCEGIHFGEDAIIVRHQSDVEGVENERQRGLAEADGPARKSPQQIKSLDACQMRNGCRSIA